ncbi:MAG: hypothetical protein A2X94_16580 [Bdellovibrionales bacterium GWB1_55_8]|nr:MAG: hypothetical protein A2X94_16580 [Bdellovibrionales bacterium GWB1_55_8]
MKSTDEAGCKTAPMEPALAGYRGFGIGISPGTLPRSSDPPPPQTTGCYPGTTFSEVCVVV